MTAAMRRTALAVLLFALCSVAWAQVKTVRFVPHAALGALDPVWTTAYVTRNHAFLVYDTLFAPDSKGATRPQMVRSWTIDKDRVVWTFTLRDGLEFHDGSQVTSSDVEASLRRWAQRDAIGATLSRFIDAYETPDDNTLRLRLKEPCGIVLEALGRAFIMPARIAATSATEQIREHVGSGPFVFKVDEFRPGERAVYVKNKRYRPRDEPTDGLAGGKRVEVDRVEWVMLRDPQTQFNAITAGEVDIVELPSYDQLPSLAANKDLVLVRVNPAGSQFYLRFNHLQPPLNNVAVRRAAMTALGQEAHLKTQVEVPGYYRFCLSVYPCGTPLESDHTGDFTGIADPRRAARMLKEAGYAGEPLVLLRPTDVPVIGKLPLVAKQQLEGAGFKVDLQQMDWGTLLARRARKGPPSDGGWHMFISGIAPSDSANPLSLILLNATGDTGFFGWQSEPRIESLKARFARTSDPSQRKALADEIQRVALDTASFVPLGQYYSATVLRKNVTGLLTNSFGVPTLWNIRKD